MATRYADEFRRDAVRIAITSGLTRPKVASDLGVGLSTLNKWVQKHQYTNGEGIMACQICKAPLPFSLDDDTPYFEKVEFLGNLKLLHYQNYLALCPNHSAMFQHANGSREVLEELFGDVEGQTLPITLAKSETSIYFTRTHLLDLKAVIISENAHQSD